MTSGGLTPEEIAQIRKLLPHTPSMIEVSKDRQAVSRIWKKAGKISIGAAAFIGAMIFLISSTGEGLKKWLS